MDNDHVYSSFYEQVKMQQTITCAVTSSDFAWH
jgi:hypothetical protein